MSSLAPVALLDNQEVVLTPSYTDAKGNVAPAPKAAPVYTSDNPAVALVTTQPDGTAMVKAVNVGTANITGSVVSDLGPTIQFPTIPVTVAAQSAQAASLVAGTPVTQP